VLILVFAIPNPVRAETVSVQSGYEKYLSLPFAPKRLSIGDTKVVDVSLVDGSTLRILGLEPGRTTFSVWREASSSPQIYEVTVAPDIGALREKMASDPNFRSANISVTGNKIVLDGRFADSGSQQEARDLAKFMAGTDILDISEVASDEVIQVDVQFATISRSTLDALGLNFSHLGKKFSIATAAPNTLQPAALNPGGNTGLDLATVAPIAGAFGLLLASPKYNTLSIISALTGNNLAQTLAEPTLVVRSGEKADFLVGGEIPIPVPQGDGGGAIAVEYKRFGVSLTIEPTILKNRRILLKIKPEVSELDYANAVVLQGFTIPAIRTRETSTTIEVNDNEPLILAGLMYKAAGKVKEKVPYLSDIPVLGEFFKRAQDTQEEQELIVSVTPHLVTSATQDTARRVRMRAEIDKAMANEEDPAIPARRRAK